MKMAATCPVCAWSVKTKGVYETHYVARRHMESAHPDKMAALREQENALRKMQSDLHALFGDALTPLGMNVR